MRLPSLLFGVALAAPAIADQPLRVTTDSPEYCGLLAARLTSQQGVDQQAMVLVAEGLRLCDSGHIRTGIAKLRRALRATHAQGG
ncbi:MAG: hypothetical protein K2X46_06800 [Roseomonas sp.]|nr:hypothetical protein [Roseomonas sp.]